MLQCEGASTSNRSPCSFPSWGQGWRAGPLYGVRVGAGQGLGPEGWPRCSAHRCSSALCRDHTPYPSSPVEFFVFSFIINPNLACISVPYNFFVFCCWRRLLSRCKHSSKGPQIPGFKSWQISLALLDMFLIRAFLSGSMESIRGSHGANGLHTFLPSCTVSALADSLLGALDPLLYHLPRKFWTFSHAVWASPFSRLPRPILVEDQQHLLGLAKPSDL